LFIETLNDLNYPQAINIMRITDPKKITKKAIGRMTIQDEKVDVRAFFKCFCICL